MERGYIMNFEDDSLEDFDPSISSDDDTEIDADSQEEDESEDLGDEDDFE